MEVGVLALLHQILFPQLLAVLLGFIVVFLLHDRTWKRIYCTIVTLPRDLTFTYHGLQFMVKLKYWEYKKLTPPKIFLEFVKRHPDKPAFIHEETVWTFKQVEQWSNQVAHYFKSIGLKRGDCVALFLEGRPEYPALWFGISKIGGITSLINTNQTGVVLQRCIEISGAKWVIYGTELSKALGEVAGELKAEKIFHLGQGTPVAGSLSLREEISKHSTSSPTEDINKGDSSDKFLYIYTSGTTGLPKAAIMTHARFAAATLAGKGLLNIRSDDIIYTALPLYHTAGGMLGVGQVILGGSTQVIRTKFSATNFFKDCVKYKCTVAQYIGEICRFLLSTPQQPTDVHHSLRLMYGNGLRRQVWKDFVARFKIPQIAEFYGATEGNSNTVNAWNKLGAVGYIPGFLKVFFPIRLIRVNEETMEPMRGKDGLCITCKIGEPGLIVGNISNSRALSQYNGYVDEDATKKKILRDVFKKGDSAFNSGDILIEDEYGYLYFKDRTGDTFRWRGENVATSEVEGIIYKVIGLKDATVYGVEVPHVEGKAGMAAILDKNGEINLNELKEGLKKYLPPYARPLFLRILRDIPMTGTFKIQKVKLQKEGYNPSVVSDKLFFYDQKSDQFKPLDDTLYKDLVNAVIKL
uniref:Very long-chain fatty acid transport protein n=1 Tax=Lygus hesperus TaxID=30085 RepID=A0A146LKS9_LYGHE